MTIREALTTQTAFPIMCTPKNYAKTGKMWDELYERTCYPCLNGVYFTYDK